MVFVRKKKIKSQYYAYLVKNEWTNKGPRQKTIKYLGKIINIQKEKDEPLLLSEIYIKDNSLDVIYKNLISNELVNHGFKLESESVFVKDDIRVNLNLKTVNSIKNNRNLVIGLNEGFLSNETLLEIFKSRQKVSIDEEGIENIGNELANSLLSAGINVSNEIFIQIFNKIYSA